MTLIATEAKRLSNVLKGELWPESAFCRLTVVANEAAAKEYLPGTVLGKVTATGKYKIAVQTAVDGSEAFGAMVLEPVSVPATTDTKVLVLVRGPARVGKLGLILDASYDLDAEKQAIYDAMEAKWIAVEEQI